MVREMTKGNPLRLILSFSIPMIFGNIFQQLYSMVDTIVVGRFVGVDALAAVGAVGSVFFLVIGFSNGICNGFSIPVAQYFGAGDIKTMRKYVVNAGILSAGFALIITVATLLFTKPLLHLMETPADIFDDAYKYIMIIFAGIPITIFYNFLSAILRALGDSKTPLKYLMISSVLNIVFDLVFVIVFKMGVVGVSVATILSQLISGVLCFMYIRQNVQVLAFDRSDIVVYKQTWKPLLRVGIPMALQFSITAIGSIVLQAAVNTLGSSVVAAVTAANKVQILMMQPLESFGITMATYGGQNLGAGHIDRIRSGVRQCLMVSMSYAVCACGISAVFGKVLVSLFVKNPSTDLLDCSQQFIITGGIFYPSLGILFIIRNLLQGLGYSFVSMFAGVTELVARTVVAFAFVRTIGFDAVCFASPVAWVVAMIMLVVLYIVKMRKLCKSDIKVLSE